MPGPVTYGARRTGTCTGTLNGEAVVDTPITLRARGEGTMGCAGGSTVMPGRITFTKGTADEGDDATLGYVGRATGAFPAFVGHARGRYSGRSVSGITLRSDPAQGEACENGTLQQASWDAVTRPLGPNVG